MGLIHCNLRVLMAERGLNIQKVKDKTTLSRTTISNLYNNYGSGIQFDTIRQLCELLKCKPGDLISYIDIKPEFEVITEEPEISMDESTHVVDEEGTEYQFISQIDTTLTLHCKLLYEGENHEFDFQTKVKYGINEKKLIAGLHIGIPPLFEFKLDRLQIPGYVESYVYNKLDDFLIEWGIEFFNDNEIEGMDISYIDHYEL
ncbi:helix-turn-helix transcriptional regulator [Bacillus mycoides]|uniref:helix-turn-helix domain-containing protein n=1 Tax=Bacillus mycoides TaxID=1405 RepID=UPI0025703F6A|nr:helix-turn-helix transcriptional regulator [Bacillus mycoides]WJE77080.1 helix-turn-helix transcriptional regulator [Bacillus mycoides]